MNADIKMLIDGFLLIFGSLVLKLVSRSANKLFPFIGYRTVWSIKSSATWIAGNQYASKVLFITGLITLGVGFLLWGVPEKIINKHYTLAAVAFLSLIYTVIATEMYLRKKFYKDGTPKKAE